MFSVWEMSEKLKWWWWWL